MFGNMKEKMQEQQELIKERLKSIKVNASSGDGAITIDANAYSEVLNIDINVEKINLENTEELEDLLMVAFNRMLEMAKTQEQMETQKALSNFLPGGLGGLFNS